MAISLIISGGQTGADQAALDAAIAMGVAHGGFVPRGRLTESGPLPGRYHLWELTTRSYPKRTERNVLAAHGTVILSHGRLRGGSRLTRDLAQRHGKPWIHLDFEQVSPDRAAREIFAWARDRGIRILNVAGSRASEDPHIYPRVYAAVGALLRLCRR